jgi:hypothetical protein
LLQKIRKIANEHTTSFLQQQSKKIDRKNNNSAVVGDTFDWLLGYPSMLMIEEAGDPIPNIRWQIGRMYRR